MPQSTPRSKSSASAASNSATKKSPAAQRTAKAKSPFRFALLGAGHIAQKAVLPAFANTRGECQLTAIISGDAAKRATLARQYRLAHTFDYSEFDAACKSGLFDALYIALPNTLHREYTIRAARHGIHILCEKPMATTRRDCQAMIDACAKHHVRLMIAYRLHFEQANMEAARLLRAKELGEPRLFTSCFTLQARENNIRLSALMGGGPLFDIGIYSLNAARYLFAAEPTEVIAMTARGPDPRFQHVEESVAVTLRFPGARLATFSCSFGAAATGWFQVVGTRGDICLDPAFEYAGKLRRTLTKDGATRAQEYPKRDQFAPELIAFARACRHRTNIECGGPEGLIDVAIIEAIYKSARTGRAVKLRPLPQDATPTKRQVLRRKVAPKPKAIKVKSGQRD
ncbi:Gfo/Idh/MocA family oxidoreductase [soil metagenome]